MLPRFQYCSLSYVTHLIFKGLNTILPFKFGQTEDENTVTMSMKVTRWTGKSSGNSQAVMNLRWYLFVTYD